MLAKEFDKVEAGTGQLECLFPSISFFFHHFELPNANSGQKETANDAAARLRKLVSAVFMKQDLGNRTI